jgi:hypothetical protein
MILKTSERNTLAKNGCGDQYQQAVSQAYRLLAGHDRKVDAYDCIT